MERDGVHGGLHPSYDVAARIVLNSNSSTLLRELLYNGEVLQNLLKLHLPIAAGT